MRNPEIGQDDLFLIKGGLRAWKIARLWIAGDGRQAGFTGGHRRHALRRQ